MNLPSVAIALSAALGSLAVLSPFAFRPSPSGSQGERPPYAVEGPLREPRLFGDGIISTGDDEFGGSFAPDGKTVYFSRSAPHSYLYAIYESHWVHGRWNHPTVTPFSGHWTDSDPVLSPDGTRMYWSSGLSSGGR